MRTAGRTKRVLVATPGMADPANRVSPVGAPMGNPQGMDEASREALFLGVKRQAEKFLSGVRTDPGWRAGPVLTSLLGMRSSEPPWRPSELWLVYEDDRDTDLEGELYRRVGLLREMLERTGLPSRLLPMRLHNQDPHTCEQAMRATLRPLLDVRGAVVPPATAALVDAAVEAGHLLPRGAAEWRRHLEETIVDPPDEIRLLTGIATNALRIATLMLGYSLGAALPASERLLPIELWHPVDQAAKAAHGERLESGPSCAPLRFGDGALPRLLTDEVAQALVRRAERQASSTGAPALRSATEVRQAKIAHIARVVAALESEGHWTGERPAERGRFKNLVVERLRAEGTSLSLKTVEDYHIAGPDGSRAFLYPWDKAR